MKRRPIGKRCDCGWNHFRVWFPFFEAEEGGDVYCAFEAEEAAESYMECFSADNPLENHTYELFARLVADDGTFGPNGEEYHPIQTVKVEVEWSPTFYCREIHK